MFKKIESYVTPIILSHVDKYIKNFKSEDTQVSLWSGAVVLHNMELKPNVIQDEFNLPFYLSSGYIHELMINVPWMKIMSESIMITINTIECVLTLKTESSSEVKQSKNKNRNVQETPPSYIQSLVNRIVNNISFRCNNLILKYVEEDIVVSVNIKHLFLDSVNGNWEPTFTDITFEDLHLRKLITLSDLTLCLDKRNAAGKIETFLEPLLYRCELQIKLDSVYSGLLQKNPLYVRCHLSSPRIEISISHQQIPMLIRLGKLFWALKKKHLRMVNCPDSNRENVGSTSNSSAEQTESDAHDSGETWTGWALSFMTPIYSTDDEEVTKNKHDPLFLFGLDLKYVSIVFKIPEHVASSSSVNVKKIKQTSTTKLVLTLVLAEMSSRIERLCFRGGFKKIELYPENQCICGISDGHLLEKQHATKFLESTTNVEAMEEKFWPIEYNEQSLIKEMTDTEMKDICPAVSIHYIYTLIIPEECKDSFSEKNIDLEYSNLKESAVLNCVLGPMTFSVSAGLFHRINMIQKACNQYDYPPYYLTKPLLSKQELPPPTTDDYDTFMEFIPKSNIRVFVFEPKIILSIWDHPDIVKEVNPSSSFSTHRKLSTTHSEFSSSHHKLLQKIPQLVFEINNVEFTLSQPMYPIRVTYVICQLPDPPTTMFDACHKYFNIKINNARCSLCQKSNVSALPTDDDKVSTKSKDLSLPILNDCTFHVILKELILPKYWVNNSLVVVNDLSINIDNISLCGTSPKLMTFYLISMGAFKMNHKCPEIDTLLTSSLLDDIFLDDMVHLEIVIDGILIRNIRLKDSSTYRLVINSIKAFAIKSNKVAGTTNDDMVWIFCAPDNLKNQSGPFVKVVYQVCSNELFSTFLTARIEESSFVLDPFLYEFLTYKFAITNKPQPQIMDKERSPTPKRLNSEKMHKRSVDESTVHPNSRVSNKYTSVQSQSDREKDFIHGSTPTLLASTSKTGEIVETSSSQVHNKYISKGDVFTQFVFDHQTLAISVEIEPLTLYFPRKPLSAVNCQTVGEAVNSSILLEDQYYSESILVVRLSSTEIKSSSLKKHLLEFCVHGLPSKIPQNVWDSDMTSYPWQINMTNFTCVTLSKSEDNTVLFRNLLKPVTSNVVISLTSKHDQANRFNSTETIISTISLLSHGLCELYASITRKMDLEALNKNATDYSISSNVHERHSLENSVNSDSQLGKNVTKDRFSCEDSGINEGSQTKEDVSAQSNKVLLTFWIQLTVSRFTAKLYANSIKQDDDSSVNHPTDTKGNLYNMKLIFDIEDIMTSFDMHPEYTKLKCKMVTANMKYCKRESNQSKWILGEHNGIILRGRENDGPLKQNEETSFIFTTLTFARCSSVHNKWNETGKKVTRKFDNFTGEFIWEIEISMQSLDVVINLSCLTAFLTALSPIYCKIQCDNLISNQTKHSNKSSNVFKRPELWCSENFPLCYFESRQIRFIMPQHEMSNTHHDVLVLQFDKCAVLPIAENPLCRQTLRPDLYEIAAREGWLGLPGGPLEDRQTQLTLKGISMYTCQWNSLTHMEESEEVAFHENPALRWNNLSSISGSLGSKQFFTIMNNVDVYVVLALSMYYKMTLVCGPSIDVGIMTDMDIKISTSQLELMSRLFYENMDAFKSVAENNYRYQNTQDCGILKSCPFTKHVIKNISSQKVINTDINQKKALFSKCHSDSEILNDKMSASHMKISESINMLGAEKKTENNNGDRKLEYFDFILTFGKVTLKLYKNINQSKMGTESQDVIPLLYIMLYQPNCFISIRPTLTISQITLFSAQISLGVEKHLLPLIMDSYPLNILETKPGIPDISTGIQPALATLKIEQNSGSKCAVKLALDCPIMFSISEKRIEQFKLIEHLITNIFNENLSKRKLLHKEKSNQFQSNDDVSSQASELVNNWDNFQSKIGSLASFEMSVVQTVLNLEKNKNAKCLISFSSLNAYASINPRLEKVFVTSLLQSLMMSLNDKQNKMHQIILNPWNIGMNFTMAWEPWRDLPRLMPVFQISLETDIFIVNLGMKEITVLKELIQYWLSVTKKHQTNDTEEFKKTIQRSKNFDFWSQISFNDQHYKDDLRAGAFKYVNCITDVAPLPYQVIIGQRQISWCYPNPRALTRLFSHPLPFQLEPGVNVSDTVVCTLQYYSDVTQSFMFYAKFYIQHDQPIKLELPINDQYMILAAVWRIQMESSSESTIPCNVECAAFDKHKFLKSTCSKTKQPVIISDHEFLPLPVSPKMLTGCLRVDSYSPPNAVPLIQYSVKLPKLNVFFLNNCDHLSLYKFADKDKLYPLDDVLPSTHTFATINFQNNLIEGSLWNTSTGILNFKFDASVDILDNHDFSLSHALCLKQAEGTVWWGGRQVKGKSEITSSKPDSTTNGVSFTVNETGIKIGSHTINTLVVATKKKVKPKFCIRCDGILHAEDLIHRYLIKNDTCVALRISQIGSNETILLASRTSTLYQWQSRKKPRLLTFAAHDGDWHSSEGFPIDECGIHKCGLIGEPGLPSLGAIIYVETLGPCHRLVTLSGCITLFNLFDKKIEFKLYQRKPNEKPMVSPIFPLLANSQHPSLFMDTTCESTFRVHFADSTAGWTGDIPLKPCPKGTLPWLVKVPVKTSEEFICLWCRVLSDPDTGRMIVVLSPLFMIRSHFPRLIEVRLSSNESRKTVDYDVFGKGTIQPLKLSGTTDTNHTISFEQKSRNRKQNSLQVPFTFERDLYKNKHSSNGPDFDTSLKNLKNWLREPYNWPYVENQYESFNWISLDSKYPEEIIVRFNYDIETIDSVIIEISPWTYFCNYSEVTLSLLDEHEIEMCNLEHKCITTPPMSKLNPYFYLCIDEDNECRYLSSKLAISTETNEPSDENLVIINATKSFLIHCEKSITVFSVHHEIFNSINVFRFTSNFVLLNQMKCDLWVVPLAIRASETSDKYTLPSDVEKFCFYLPENEDSCQGKSITHFFLNTPDKRDPNKIYKEQDFSFYIWIGLSTDCESFGCPIRVDKFTPRRCTSLKIDNSSIPITISCKRENEQTYISVTEDSCPQLIIQNNADVCIAVGQSITKFSSDEQTSEILDECDLYKWHHKIATGAQTHYTMPTLAKYFPDLSNDSDHSITHLAFALSNSKDEFENHMWSTPVNVSITSSEQCVKLPEYNKDIKVSVIYHVHSTYITLENISQADISAGKIRSRLLTSVNESNQQGYLVEENSDFDIKVETSSLHDTNLLKASIDENTMIEMSSNSPVHYSSTLLEFLSKTNILFMINSLSVTLNASGECKQKDISSLSCQNVVFTSQPFWMGTNITLTFHDVQLDNPLHCTGEYDYPVVLIKKIDNSQTPEGSSVQMLYSNPHNAFEKKLQSIQTSRSDALVNLKIVVEIWNQEFTTYSAINEVNLSVKPLSSYIEDKYMKVLVNYVAEFGPWNDESSCSCRRFKNSHSNDHIYVPFEIVTEMSILAKPVQMGSLKVNPIDVVLSLHANLQVYIALDHSPLLFSKFERNNLLTTSYGLGHALTMHYLSETIYRAGWVVGSLEILGSPGGLVRRVGVGLMALVAEPCLGLLGRGPWGFIVGITHGSAVLLKQVTQGTAESVSMMASNVARNLDKLSLDTEYVRKTEAARRTRPRGLPQGLAQGIKALALGVVGGATDLVTSSSNFTKGILGVVTKPLSATADLVAFTTQGLLDQVGWNPQPQPMEMLAEEQDDWASEWQEWRLKLGHNFLIEGLVLHACKGRHRDTGNNVAMIITNKWLLLIDIDREKVQQIIDLSTIVVINNKGKNLCIAIHKDPSKEDLQESVVRARVAAYVGENIPIASSGDDLLNIYMPSSDISFVISILNIARENAQNLGFPVL